MPVDPDFIPLMNGEEDLDEPKANQTVDWDNFTDKHEYLSDDDDFVSDDGKDSDDDDPAEARKKHEPDEEGKYHDDPLWWGKTLAEIRHATDDAKACGNKSHREGDQQAANRHWKNALKGSQKLKERETEFRLRLNLAMGYTKAGKTTKALDQCTAALRDDLRSAAPVALIAKAHYRRAEAYTAAGEIDKAMGSIKSSLQLEPGNIEARNKLAELKRLELENRKREKALFAGKRLLEAMSDPQSNERTWEGKVENADSGEEDDDEEGEEENDEEDFDECEDAEAADIDVSTLTDRSQADQLGQKMIGGNGINFVGDRVDFLGPLNVDKIKADS